MTCALGDVMFQMMLIVHTTDLCACQV